MCRPSVPVTTIIIIIIIIIIISIIIIIIIIIITLIFDVYLTLIAASLLTDFTLPPPYLVFLTAPPPPPPPSPPQSLLSKKCHWKLLDSRRTDVMGCHCNAALSAPGGSSIGVESNSSFFLKLVKGELRQQLMSHAEDLMHQGDQKRYRAHGEEVFEESFDCRATGGRENQAGRLVMVTQRLQRQVGPLEETLWALQKQAGLLRRGVQRLEEQAAHKA
ncbi:unnamed protein product [Pleuronectes platessa]|uniref:Uncharacterized protein n=1 Tax=Pleuronectes platessa TaxID=8262 RepID=A0A9N7YCP9_PLEPL|nr:unnamed protein product [Pleuronectes platessa]